MRHLLVGLLAALCIPNSALAQDQVKTVWRPSQKHADVSTHLMKNRGALESVPKRLGSALKLPRELPIRYQDYGALNAVYDPNNHQVTMGYEICDHAFKVFREAGYDSGEATKLAIGAFTFVLLHEFGHAMISELELPVTGREEDCADEFATWVCANLLPNEGPQVARSGALFFFYMGKNRSAGSFPWFDEHSFDLQRAYRIAADINAHYPNSVPEITRSIPKERLREAVALKAEKKSHWLRQLAPHLVFDTTGYPRLKPAVTKAREGHLRGRLGSSQNPAVAGLLKKWQGTNAHGKMLTIFDDMFLWPRDLDVLFTDTGTRQCSYSKAQGRIVISLDMFGDMAQQLSKAGLKGTELESHLLNLVSYAVWYEMSRAVIGEMDLPYTGAPEDAANELTTMMIASVPRGHGIGIAMFDWLALQSANGTGYVWSDQSLDIQQMYDMAGYLFAADPERYGAGIERIIPSKARLRRYYQDYKAKEKRWSELILPYVER